MKSLTSNIAIIVFTILLSLAACNKSKKAASQINKQELMNNQIQDSTDWSSAFEISAPTKLFISQVQKEISAETIQLENYIPSKELMDKYGIRKQNDQYIISGFIKTTDNFNSNDFEKKDISLGSDNNGIRSIRFPLPLLPEFLKSKNINYFQINEKVQLD